MNDIPGLFDFHTHILFDTDHGVQKQEDMEKMFDKYKAEGFSSVVLTPHIYNPAVECKVNNIRANYEKAQEAAEKRDLTIYLGCELYLESQTEIKTIPIANAYALVEFPTEYKLVGLESKLKQIVDKGLIPVIAHIERYSWIKLDSKEVELFRNLGCLIQVNQSGIASRAALQYVKAGIVDIIASDNHGDFTLPAKLRKALEQYPEIVIKMQGMDL